jgi:DNA replication and repair protein RecF
MLALSSRAYLGALREYRTALDQRNAAIRAAQRTGRGPGSVAAWEPALAARGAALVAARRAWVGSNADAFAHLCRALGESGAARMQYTGDAARADDPAATLADLLDRDRQRDLQRGMTGVGPHRDDVSIAIDGHDARTFGSAGQQRTAAIALRLLEARTLRAQAGAHPMLLLDDPFAELDRNRTIGALSLLVAEEPGQVVLAVPREDDIPRDFAHLTRWRMRGGEIQV